MCIRWLINWSDSTKNARWYNKIYNILSLYETGRLKTSYKIASDITVWIHLTQDMVFCEHINENCGIVLAYLIDHKILKEEPLVRFANNVENEIIRRFLTQFLMNIFSHKTWRKI